MKDVMVDLETLGNSPGAAILSIGAVAFDPETGEIDDKGFYAVVDVNSCVVAGLRFDQGTLDWWKQQSDDARQVLKQAWSGKALDLRASLCIFNEYIGKFGGRKVRVWGNGADFDNALLAYAYRVTGVRPGWDFWNSRCFRTLKNLRPDITIERVGTFHNAKDDAHTQAVHALKIFAELRSGGARGREFPNGYPAANEAPGNLLGTPEMEAALAADRAKLEALGADPGPTAADLGLDEDLVG